jgi:mono/diheme cytochrome c family protein
VVLRKELPQPWQEGTLDKEGDMKCMRWNPFYFAISWLFLVSGSAMLALGLPQAKDEEWKAPPRASKKENPIPADEKSIARGKALYTEHCLSCHGATGKGDGPAAKDLPKKCGDLSNPKMWEQTDGDFFWKITEGKPPMTGYEKLLDKNDRWHVINYMRTLAPKPKAGDTK